MAAKLPFRELQFVTPTVEFTLQVFFLYFARFVFSHPPFHDFVFDFTNCNMITDQKWPIAPLNSELSEGDLNKKTNWVIE